MDPEVDVSQHSGIQGLRGIKVTGNPPPVEAPSRVVMKLKGPEISRKGNRYGKSAPSLRIGPSGLEYVDTRYSQSVHVGGRGHFGVVGSGQSLPQPVIEEKREHFCILPQDVAGDHCYGKSPPPVGGTNLAAVGPLFGGVGRGQQQQRRIHMSGFGHVRPGQMIRVLPRYSISPPSHHGASFLTGTTGEFYDDEDLGDLSHYEGMEVVGFSDSPGPSGSHQHSMASPLTLLPQRRAPMLSDKLPANILEGVDDGDLTGDPSIDIH